MSSSSSLERVGECLYRNPSSGTHYAWIKQKGKQIKRSLGTKDLSEARRKLRDFRNEAERLDSSAGRVTFNSVIEKYLTTIQHQAPSTVTGKMGICDRILEHWPGGSNRLISKIKPSEAMEFLSRYPGQSRHRQALEVLRCIFNLAVGDKIIARSPVEEMHQRKPERPIRSTPTTNEFEAIVKSIRTQPWSDTREESADFVEFLGLAGMGQAEAGALAWGDLDFARNQFTTFRHKTRKGFVVPIFPQLRPLLEKRLSLATVENGGRPPRSAAKVFAVADAKKSLKGACDRLGLTSYSSRAFRRMFVTRALERGVDVKVVSQWQGHQDGGKLILDTYSHVRSAHAEQMARLMTAEG